jgi:hypothetical protein
VVGLGLLTGGSKSEKLVAGLGAFASPPTSASPAGGGGGVTRAMLVDYLRSLLLALAAMGRVTLRGVQAWGSEADARAARELAAGLREAEQPLSPEARRLLWSITRQAAEAVVPQAFGHVGPSAERITTAQFADFYNTGGGSSLLNYLELMDLRKWTDDAPPPLPQSSSDEDGEEDEDEEAEEEAPLAVLPLFPSVLEPFGSASDDVSDAAQPTPAPAATGAGRTTTAGVAALSISISRADAAHVALLARAWGREADGALDAAATHAVLDSVAVTAAPRPPSLNPNPSPSSSGGGNVARVSPAAFVDVVTKHLVRGIVVASIILLVPPLLFICSCSWWARPPRPRL